MANLAPEQYYPCLAPEEQGACRLAYASVVPPYIYVIPKDPIDSYFQSLTTNFEGRQENWAETFRFKAVEIEIIPGVERWVYTDLYGFLEDWRLYPPINGGTDDTHCREYEYSDIGT